MTKEDVIADAIVRLIKETPKDWKVDRYEFIHKKKGIVVWIAYGEGGCNLRTTTASSEELPAGLFDSGSKHTNAIWKAYSEWLGAHLDKFSDKLLKDLT